MNPEGNNVLVEMLGSSLRHGGSALSHAPAMLKRVLREQAWREFLTRMGEHVRHERFADFVTTPPLRGLGADISLVRRVVERDPEALDLLDQALQNPAHAHADVNNINVSRPQGTSRDQALRKLRTEAGRGNEKAAQLHAAVLAGRISAHAAMIQAGFRDKTISVPVGKPERMARYIRRHMPGDAIRRLAELLTQDEP